MGTEVQLLHSDCVCPRCGAFLEHLEMAEPTLFRHGGYGATRVTEYRLCTAPGCRWELLSSVKEVNPNTLPLPTDMIRG